MFHVKHLPPFFSEVRGVCYLQPLGNLCICNHLEHISVGNAFALVGILVVLGHEAGAEGAHAQVVGDAKLVQALANSFPQEDIQRADHAGLAAQSTVDLAYDFTEGAALLGKSISQFIELGKGSACYEIKFKIIQLLVVQ